MRIVVAAEQRSARDIVTKQTVEISREIAVALS